MREFTADNIYVNILENLLLAHLCTKCEVSFCDRFSSVVRLSFCPAVHFLLQTTFPSKSMDQFMDQFQNYFT